MSEKSARKGFTLIELLVAMSIIAVLVALVFSASGGIQAHVNRSKAISNMRSIGNGITLFAADNGGYLPGPLWPGQLAEFDPARAGRLVRELAPYLGIATPSSPQVVDLFMPPAYRKQMPPASLSTARTFVMNMSIAQDTATLNPWGSLAMNDGSKPFRLAAIPAGVWGFSDADRQHPRVTGASWATNTPLEPIHGKRLAWFFNGSVSPVETETLQ